MPISVLILTLNEEQNLAACLESVKWSDDIVVFDSFSTDSTAEIARAYGARVVQRAFDNENYHRTASLQVGFKHRWVYNPDADEIATAELSKEMHDTVANCPEDMAAFRVRRKDMFMGQWLKHSSLYPTWFMRLLRPEKVRFERIINMRAVTEGREGQLKEHLLHYSFNKGLEPWIEKHNRYSTAEAMETLAVNASVGECLRTALTNGGVERRNALKNLSQLVPCRPSLRFFYMYLFRLGFLDGMAGLRYCRMLAMYEYMISLKVLEARRRAAKLPV